jgi:hypothetical protein
LKKIETYTRFPWMDRRSDRINAESPESNYHEEANSLLSSLSFEAKPHLSRGGFAGVEGMAGPSRKRN